MTRRAEHPFHRHFQLVDSVGHALKQQPLHPVLHHDFAMEFLNRLLRGEVGCVSDLIEDPLRRHVRLGVREKAAAGCEREGLLRCP